MLPQHNWKYQRTPPPVSGGGFLRMSIARGGYDVTYCCIWFATE
jgi:hypothetical protein